MNFEVKTTALEDEDLLWTYRKYFEEKNKNFTISRGVRYEI